jgi:protein SCO1/2
LFDISPDRKYHVEEVNSFSHYLSLRRGTHVLILTAQVFAVSLVWAPHVAGGDPGAPHEEVGIAERLGEHVPTDLAFLDEEGREVRLGELIDRPTVLALVYLSCRDVCPMLLRGTAEVMGKIEEDENFRVIALSFDERDTPEAARKAKENYLGAVGRPFPPERWNFLTGDARTIRKLTDSVGFGFARMDGGFSHTAALIFLSPDGKIVRYIYGVSFLPFDMAMGLAEAESGTTGSVTNRLLLYCFSYDPEGRTYVFNALKVAGTVMLVFIGLFIAYLRAVEKKRSRELERGNP